jgi:hypothetical protein
LQILASFRRGLLGFAGLASHSGRSTIPFRVLRSGTVEFPFQLNQPREPPYPHPADPISGRTTPDKQQSIRKKRCSVKSSSRKMRGNFCGKSQQNCRENLERVEYSTNSAGRRNPRNPRPGCRSPDRVPYGQGRFKRSRRAFGLCGGHGSDFDSPTRKTAKAPSKNTGRPCEALPLQNEHLEEFSLSNPFRMPTYKNSGGLGSSATGYHSIRLCFCLCLQKATD